VQLKFSAVMEASGGLTIPADGMGGSSIVKLPSPRFAAVPENEYTMLALARAVGINVPPNQLIEMTEQLRRFANTARLPASPLWPIVAETAERTVAAWKGLAEKRLLAQDMAGLIGMQILGVARTIRKDLSLPPWCRKDSTRKLHPEPPAVARSYAELPNAFRHSTLSSLEA
jgi:hypothetical protein